MWFNAFLVLEPFTISYKLELNLLPLKPLAVAKVQFPQKYKVYMKLLK